MTTNANSNPIDAYALSPVQEGMLFHTLYAPGSGVYFEQRWCLLQGNLDVAAFRAAWQQALDRHTVLRSAFHWAGLDQPLQVVYDHVELPLKIGDWQTLTAAEQEQQLQQHLLADRARGFELTEAPLMRCALFKLGPQLHRFVWSYHHLLMDGWCNGMLIAEVLQLYSSQRNAVAAALPAPKPFRDFIDWLQQQDHAATEQFWRAQLDAIDVPTPISHGKAVQAASNAGQFHEQQHVLDAEIGARLHDFARRNRLTLNTLVQGAWALWLARNAGRDDVVFGGVAATRPPALADAERMMGLFINTVPVRVRIDDESAIIDWLQQIQNTQREREAHGHCALADIQRWAGVAGGGSLFDSILVFENYPLSTAMALAAGNSGLAVEDAAGYERTHFPLALMVIPEANTLRLCARHDSAFMSQAMAQRLLRQLQAILGNLADTGHRTLGDIDAIDADELAWQRVAGQGPRIEATGVPVHDAIVREAMLQPQQIAVVFDNGEGGVAATLTWQQLDQRSAQLAAFLQARGIGRGDRVGVCIERSLDLIVALLAVLRSGAAYVPLDPTYPPQRLAHVAEDAQMALLLTAGNVAETASWLPAQLSSVDLHADAAAIAACYAVLQPVNLAANDLAYVIYTSGSTGKPKGVAVRHGGLANFMMSMRQAPGLNAQDRLLAITTVAFDIAALELFLPLLCGARLVIAAATAARDAQQLAALVEAHAITVLQASPSSWRLLRENRWQGNPGLKMLCGGEALDVPLAHWLLQHGGELWNLYGPTETTIWSAALQLHADMLVSGVPVGGAIANTTLQVLDEKLRPLPTGAAGQLYIGGDGLAAGYFGQPQLTAAAFITTADGTALYRTGDRVCWRDDGRLDFLGRLDSQIKLRGYRIEPGEIEQVLSRCEDVAQAVVLLRRDEPENPQLVAYLTLKSDVVEATTLTQVRDAAQAQLPVYMLPAHWIVMPQMPLTPNGKVDRKALPAPAASAEPATPVAATQDTLQDLIAVIWAQVLGSDRSFGADDDFFALGGHSLAATRVVAQLQELCGVDIALRSLFEYPRLADFCERVRQRQQLSATVAAPIERLPRGGRLPLSWAQRRQWLIAQLDPAASAYNIAIALQLDGVLDIAALQWSFAQLVQRHETLRLAFVADGGEPWAQTVDLPPTPLETENLETLSAAERDFAISDAIARERSTAFDIAQPPLWRTRLLRSSATSHVLLLTLHHIVADDWSLGVLVRELGQLYAARCDDANAVSPLPALSLQYADVAQWQRSRDVTPSLAYWRSQLAALPEPMALPTISPAAESTQAAQVASHIDAAQVAGLRALGRQHGATLFMTLLAGFYVLLSRYSGSRDIVVGSPIANRQQADVQNLVGMFVNTLLLRANLDNAADVPALLAQVRRTTLAAYEHQDLPFEQLLDALPALRQQQQEPIQALFALQGAPLETLSLAGLQWTTLTGAPAQAKFELSLSLRETATTDGVALTGVIEYRADRFDAALIERMALHYRQLLAQMVAHPQQTLSALPMLSPIELDVLRQQARRPAPLFSGAIHDYFGRVAQAQPDAVAIIDGATRLNYRELDVRSNQLAHFLIQQGIAAETPVGLWGDRCADSIVAMLAIVKAGAFFVPLDPQAPPARLGQIIERAGITLVIAADADRVQIGVTQVPWRELVLSTLAVQLAQQLANAPAIVVTPDRLAYAMHTSGSTGVPKGVATAHRGVLRLVVDADYVSLSNKTVMLHAAPLAFDASTLEIWGALLNGGTLVIQRSALSSLADTAELLREYRIDTAWFTAGLFQLMVDEQLDALCGLQQLLAGGDVLSLPHLRRLQAAAPSLRLINGYGPTEATTFTCCHTLTPADLAAGSVPIGTPIAGTSAYVLDNNMQPLPAGVAGELFIGGAGLARGYLNQPAASAAAFVPNPFFDLDDAADGDAAQMLYRSGDRVRMRDDGVIEFLGRVDRQVKIRGFRIETGDIEQALLAHAAIRNALVQRVDSDGRHRLVAWYTADTALAPAQLRTHLAERLPDYMLPAAFVWLQQLPLTANGKIDRAALPAPDFSTASESDVAAADALEQVLLQLWQSVLPAPSIGVHDNFFELGGDSIIAMQIASRAAQAGLVLTPAQLFTQPTVAMLAAALRQLPANIAHVANAEPASGDMPLTPVLQWFFDRELARPAHFNQATMLRLPAGTDLAALQDVLDYVVQRHDAFRLRFARRDNGWQSWFADDNHNVAVEHINLTAIAPAERNAFIEHTAQRLHGSLDLEHGPLLRVAFFAANSDESARLLVVAHHLVVDGVSWRVLMADLQRAWMQKSQGRAPALGPRPAGIQRWSRQLRELPVDAATAAYWHALAELSPAPLPLEAAGDANRLEHAERVTLQLSADATNTLLRDLPKRGEARVTDALLVALTHTICQWSGHDRLLLDVETHGRDDGIEFSQTVGWFTAIYPMLLSSAPTSLQSVQAVALLRAAVPHNGLSWGVLRYLHGDAVLACPQSRSAIVFNYLGQLDATVMPQDGLVREAAPGVAVHGDNERTHLFDINSWIDCGLLTLEWTYSTRHHTQSRIIALAQSVIAALQALAAEIAGVEQRSADFTLADIDDDALAAALAQVSFGN